MPVRIRFARYGKKNHPFYRILVADHRRIPTGKFLEQIGTYNPIVNMARVKDLRLNTSRAKYWLSVGAQPSPGVARLFGMFNLLPPPPQRNSTLAHFPDPILRFGPKTQATPEIQTAAETQAASIEVGPDDVVPAPAA